MSDENSGETRDGVGDVVSHLDALSRRTTGDERDDKSLFVVTLWFRGDDDEVVVVVEAAVRKCTCRGLTNG